MSIYDSCVVAFIDILGFKEVLKSESKAEEIHRALYSIKNNVDSHYGSDSYRKFKGVLDTEMTAFSDSVVISGSLEQAVAVYFDTLRFLDLILNSGFVCRGALSSGSLYHRDGIVFGPALVDAYEDESKRAVYPRVIVSPDVRELILNSENNPGEFCDLLKEDHDGRFFIDLREINKFNNESSFIEERLRVILGSYVNVTDKSIIQKHQWLRNAYNIE